MKVKTLSINLSGGFHGVGGITVRPRINGRAAYLSDSQIRRIERHFCGMKSCICGGVERAEKELPAGWEIAGSMNEPGTAHFYYDPRHPYDPERLAEEVYGQ
jgi:hypothetical protein